jgi:ectoine hydroxylase-related dioxygenase (phytanoyl-CoA dioxygenase family)
MLLGECPCRVDQGCQPSFNSGPRCNSRPGWRESIVALRLAEAERRRYIDEGFFVREAVFGDADIERFRAAAERVVGTAARASTEVLQLDAGAPRSPAESLTDYSIDGNRYVEAAHSTVQFEHGSDSETIRVIEPFHHLDPVFDGLVEDPRIVTPVCGVLGLDRVALWTDKINLKRPFEGSGFRWHQDSPYWSHACGHCDQLPNVMITLDDADRENGCFRLIPGSHRNGFLPGLNDGSRLGPLFTDPACFDESAEWLAEVPAGSVIVFDAHIVHGSEPNLSERSRRAIVLTYQPADHPMFKASGIRNFPIDSVEGAMTSAAKGDRAAAAGNS